MYDICGCIDTCGMPVLVNTTIYSSACVPAPTVPCVALLAPVSGTVSSSSGPVATYSCNTGYTIFGTAQSTCNSNGSWTSAGYSQGLLNQIPSVAPTCSIVTVCTCTAAAPFSNVSCNGMQGMYSVCGGKVLQPGYLAQDADCGCKSTS
jgi:Sushi repeat (SCR repeat)